MAEHKITSFHQLPITGIEPSPWVAQRTVEELSEKLTPLLEHEEIAEFGWTQVALPLESDHGIWDVRDVWLRTVHDAGRARRELRLFAADHPTLGRVFQSRPTPLHALAAQLEQVVRDSAYMSALLELFGTGASVVVSRAGIVLEEVGIDEPDSAAAAEQLKALFMGRRGESTERDQR
ncbi:hypothetical protein ACIGXM_14015 [Kitasatospora sp. NPDC052896]|uniref:hypothetical protein n=1 Tax=Kitasatospora sp. NPDC052896 TaxID=3364061 RepID=UPI0037C8D708